MAKRKVPMNLVVVSGMQGSGKDTLLEDLLYTYPDITSRLPCQVMRYRKCKMTTFRDLMERQIRRIAKYAIDWCRAIKVADDHPDLMVVTDRCYHDGAIFIDALQFLDWITTKERDYLRDLLDDTFSMWNTDQIKPFFLNPPLEFIQQNLKKRQMAGLSKWREDDEDYIKLLFKSYNYYFTKYDPYGIAGIDSAECIPGYECCVTDRKERVGALVTCLKRRWYNYTHEDDLPYDWEDPKRWSMSEYPKN